jgi:hypothetical protein
MEGTRTGRQKMLSDCSREQLEGFMHACQTLLSTPETLTEIRIGTPVYTELHLYRRKVETALAAAASSPDQLLRDEMRDELIRGRNAKSPVKRIAADYALKAVSGQLRKRDIIPNREICDGYGVSAYTATRAKKLLAEHGILELINGVYFVA